MERSNSSQCHFAPATQTATAAVSISIRIVRITLEQFAGA